MRKVKNYGVWPNFRPFFSGIWYWYDVSPIFTQVLTDYQRPDSFCDTVLQIFKTYRILTRDNCIKSQ